MTGPAGTATPMLPPGAVPILLGAMLFFGLYMVYEVWRWFAGNRAMLTPGQFRRRLVAGFILELDLLMWVMADPLISGRPARERLLYLLWATLLVFIPMILAVREAAFIMRQYARWRGEIVRGMAKGGHRGENGSAP